MYDSKKLPYVVCCGGDFMTTHILYIHVVLCKDIQIIILKHNLPTFHLQ